MFYKADRVFSSIEPKYVEKVQLKSDYAIDETLREEFKKYLIDLKMTQALAVSGEKKTGIPVLVVHRHKAETNV